MPKAVSVYAVERHVVSQTFQCWETPIIEAGPMAYAYRVWVPGRPFIAWREN